MRRREGTGARPRGGGRRGRPARGRRGEAGELLPYPMVAAAAPFCLSLTPAGLMCVKRCEKELDASAGGRGCLPSHTRPTNIEHLCPDRSELLLQILHEPSRVFWGQPPNQSFGIRERAFLLAPPKQDKPRNVHFSLKRANFSDPSNTLHLSPLCLISLARSSQRSRMLVPPADDESERLDNRSRLGTPHRSILSSIPIQCIASPLIHGMAPRAIGRRLNLLEPSPGTPYWVGLIDGAAQHRTDLERGALLQISFGARVDVA